MCMYGHAKVVVPEQKRLSRPLGDELHAFLFDNPLVIFAPGKSHYGKNKHHLIKVKLDFWQSQKNSHDDSGISTQNIYLFIYEIIDSLFLWTRDVPKNKQLGKTCKFV